MAGFVARRTVRLVLSLAVVVSASFSMIHLIPGDPVRAALGVGAPAEAVAAKQHELGLDLPLLTQYGDYLRRLAHGDLGVSLVSGEPVAQLIRERLPNTLAIATLAFAAVLLLAFPVGLLAAVHTRDGRRPRSELSFTAATATVASFPEFVLAAALSAGLAVAIPLFPVAGQSGPSSYVLPVLALSLGPAAVLARFVRVEALNALSADYMRTARAKRLPARLLYLRHAAPNMVTASLTVAGNMLPALIAGTVLVESIFAWPGLGTAIATSVVNRDYFVVQAMVLILGTAVLAANFLIDVLLTALNPRSALRGA
ncbi:ABC transporter permease [Nonomuraea sp. NPDC050536]|uniref:ABC transporter permease n=1 Tax=Nonomuraea sp. NPDC050536 TaxID=3364366 RepID=UPI0037C5B07A